MLMGNKHVWIEVTMVAKQKSRVPIPTLWFVSVDHVEHKLQSDWLVRNLAIFWLVSDKIKWEAYLELG
jgi:hypothetical protein